MFALEIKDLVKTYKNGTEAVKKVSFSVQKGDFFALLGPNGAGKSTAINIICSLVNKSSGKVNVHGFDLDTEQEKVKSYIGLVPQEFNFNFFEKPIDIVVQQAGYYGVSRSIALKRAERYLKQLNLWHKRDVVAMTLSGGMKRKLMIVRALLHEPKLLILDEPTAGVDVETRKELWDFLLELQKKRNLTIILTTHYLEEAEQLCKHIAIVDQGTLIENTNMKTLLATLEQEVFVLDIKEPLKVLPDSPYELTLEDAHTIRAVLQRGKSVTDLLTFLKEHSIVVQSMRNESNRLESLFMRLVRKHGV